VDEKGNGYSTFRPEIGRKAPEAEGSARGSSTTRRSAATSATSTFDAVEALEGAEGEGDGEADEVAWRTAIEAAPWLAGEPTPKSELPADELFEKLKPFKDLVEEDIEADR
jgi:hypothetical protein